METREPNPPDASSKRESAAATRPRGIRRILVAVDDTERSLAVVKEAIALARAARAALCFYEAVEVPPEFPPAAATYAVDPLPAYLHRKAETRLRDFARSAADLGTETAIDESPNAGESIVRAARRYRADLIVMGSHKYGIVERVLGTTIAHVITSAECDVLAVRGEAPLPHGGPGEPPLVLACLDHSSAALEVYRAAATMARARRLPLRALRVVTDAGEAALVNDALTAEAVRDLEDIANKAAVGTLTGAIGVVDPSVGRAICKVANALPGALVVVGAHQVGRLRSLVAVAPHVIRHCARSVLVVRLPESTPS